MIAGIAMGSNLGDSEITLRQARQSLAELGPVQSGGLYESEPVGCPPGSPPFLNTALELETTLRPTELLKHCLEMEVDHGRPPKHGVNAPRTLDLDLIYCDQIRMNEPALVLPHPRARERLFVLAPLADIRPDLVLPGEEKSLAELMRALESRESPPRLVKRNW